MKKVEDLLQIYSEFLEKEGYLDTDWRDEGEAISDFLKSKKYKEWNCNG